MGGINLDSFRAMASGDLNLGSVMLETDEKTKEQTLVKVNNTLNGRKIRIQPVDNAKVRGTLLSLMADDLRNSLGDGIEGVEEFIGDLHSALIGANKENAGKDLERKGDLSKALNMFDAFKARKLVERDVKDTKARARTELWKAREAGRSDYDSKENESRIALEKLKTKYRKEVVDELKQAQKKFDEVENRLHGKICKKAVEAERSCNTLKNKYLGDSGTELKEAEDNFKKVKDDLKKEALEKINTARKSIADLEKTLLGGALQRIDTAEEHLAALNPDSILAHAKEELETARKNFTAIKSKAEMAESIRKALPGECFKLFRALAKNPAQGNAWVTGEINPGNFNSANFKTICKECGVELAQEDFIRIFNSFDKQGKDALVNGAFVLMFDSDGSLSPRQALLMAAKAFADEKAIADGQWEDVAKAPGRDLLPFARKSLDDICEDFYAKALREAEISAEKAEAKENALSDLIVNGTRAEVNAGLWDEDGARLVNELKDKIADLERVRAEQDALSDLFTKDSGAVAEARGGILSDEVVNQVKTAKEEIEKAEKQSETLNKLLAQELADDIEPDVLDQETFIAVKAAKGQMELAKAKYDARLAEWNAMPASAEEGRGNAGLDEETREIIEAKAYFNREQDAANLHLRKLEDLLDEPFDPDAGDKPDALDANDVALIKEAKDGLAKAQAKIVALKEALEKALPEDELISEIESAAASPDYGVARAKVKVWRRILESQLDALKKEAAAREGAPDAVLKDIKKEIADFERLVSGAATDRKADIAGDSDKAKENLKNAKTELEGVEKKAADLKKFLVDRLAAKRSELAGLAQGAAVEVAEKLKAEIARLDADIKMGDEAEARINGAVNETKAKAERELNVRLWQENTEADLQNARDEHAKFEAKKAEWRGLFNLRMMDGANPADDKEWEEKVLGRLADNKVEISDEAEDWEKKVLGKLKDAKDKYDAAKSKEADSKKLFDPVSKTLRRLEELYGETALRLSTAKNESGLLRDATLDSASFSSKEYRALCKESGVKVSEKSFIRIFSERREAIVNTALRILYAEGGDANSDPALRKAILRAVEQLRVAERAARDTRPKTLDKTDKVLIGFLRDGVKVQPGMTHKDAVLSFLSGNNGLEEGICNDLLGRLKFLARNEGRAKSTTFDMPVSAGQPPKTVSVTFIQAEDNSLAVSYKNHVFKLPRTAREIVDMIRPALILDPVDPSVYDNYNIEQDEETKARLQNWGGQLNDLRGNGLKKDWIAAEKARLTAVLENSESSQEARRAANLQLANFRRAGEPYDDRVNQTVFVKRIDRMINTLRECNNARPGFYGGAPHFRDKIPRLASEDAKTVKIFGIDTGRTRTFFRSFWNKAASTGDVEIFGKNRHFGTFVSGLLGKALSKLSGVPLQAGEGGDKTKNTIFEKATLYLHQLRLLAQNANWLISRFDKTAPEYTDKERNLSDAEFVKQACREVNRITQFQLHDEGFTCEDLANKLHSFLELSVRAFEYSQQNGVLGEFYETISKTACMQDCIRTTEEFCDKYGVNQARDKARPENERLKPLEGDDVKDLSPKDALRFRDYEKRVKANKPVVRPDILDELNGNQNRTILNADSQLGVSLTSFIMEEIGALNHTFNPPGTRKPRVFSLEELKPYLTERLKEFDEFAKDTKVANEKKKRRNLANSYMNKLKGVITVDRETGAITAPLLSADLEVRAKEWLAKYNRLDKAERAKIWAEAQRDDKLLAQWLGRYASGKIKITNDRETMAALIDMRDPEKENAYIESFREQQGLELSYYDDAADDYLRVKFSSPDFWTIAETALKSAGNIKNGDRKLYVRGDTVPAGSLKNIKIKPVLVEGRDVPWNEILHGHDFVEVTDASGSIKYRTPDGQFEIAGANFAPNKNMPSFDGDTEYKIGDFIYAEE